MLLGGTQSDWRETISGGRTLLRESGRLNGLGLGIRLPASRRRPASRWQVEASLQRLAGTRAYRGQDSLGAPVTTSVDLAQRDATLAASAPWADLARDFGLPPADLPARLGLQLQHTAVDRRLQGTATAQGYLERWRWWTTQVQASLDGRWSGKGGEGGEAGGLVWRVQLGSGPAWPAEMVLQLLDRDAATLRPRHGWHHQAAAGLEHGLGRSTLGLQLQWQHTRFGASEVVPLYSQGVLRGGALQPATHIGGLSLGLSWRMALAR